MSFIIPAIDIIDGNCVRLTEGVYSSSKVYSTNPLEAARGFEEAGCNRLHLVDLDGAKKGAPCNLSILEAITQGTSLKVDYSGGLRTKESIENAFGAGASYVCIGSLAVKEPSLFCEFIRVFGEDRVILSADVRGDLLAIHGWEKQTSQSIFSLLEEIRKEVPLKRVIVTDISKDGRLEGPSFDLYKRLKESCENLEIIASGGVHSLDDVTRLKELSLGGVVVGKAIYEGVIPYQSLGGM
jgi:phosphoribosylformimino-5-aminoimidazole carboxamide ribotide isomerase